MKERNRMIRSRTLAVCVILSFSITPALAKCELSNFVFQDQKGVEAVVKDVRECFGWFDQEKPSRSSANICQTEKSVEAMIKKFPKRDLRLVGSRIIKVIYKKQYFDITELAVVGSPWLSYSVKRGTNAVDKEYKIGRNIYSLLDGEIEFDFTEDGPRGWEEPRIAFKGLFGKKFVYSRCVS